LTAQQVGRHDVAIDGGLAMGLSNDLPPPEGLRGNLRRRMLH
jgi:hypothetical protein